MKKFLCVVMMGCVASLLAGTGAYGADHEDSVVAALESKQLKPGAEQSSLSNFTVNGFEAIDNSNLIVNSGVSQQFLITLATPCLELPFALSIGFDRRSSNISNFDSIVVNSQGQRSETCRISRIYSLDSATEK